MSNAPTPRGFFFTSLLLVTRFISQTVASDSIETGNPIHDGMYCNLERMHARCPENHVIVMKTAKYGRMELGRCVTINLGYIGCQGNVLDLMDRACSGRQQCHLEIPNTIFNRTTSCLEDLKFYLEASYSCLEVVKPAHTSCSTCEGIPAPPPPAYIASSTTQRTGCGSRDCPWRIQALPGQTINITLINFNWTIYQRYPGQEDMTVFRSRPQCSKVYAVMKDITDEPTPLSNLASRTICGSDRRIENVYSSQSSVVEIRLMGLHSTADNAHQFLFKYEAIGCPNVQAPLGGWTKRDDADPNKLTVGCDADKQKIWRLSCVGNEWDSNIPLSCSGATGSEAATDSKKTGFRLPYGLSLAVVVLVAVLVGALILVIGLVIVQRKYAQGTQNLNYNMTQDLPPTYSDKNYSPTTAKSQQQQHYMLKQVTDQPHPPPGVGSYVHIWDRPLPEPDSVDVGACAASGVYHQQHSEQSYGSESNDYHAVGSESYSTGTGEDSQRGRKGQVYGNNTMARREVDTASVLNAEESRYFAIDPTRERHHSLG